MKPVELLQEQLNEWESALKHSTKAYLEGKIDKKLYDKYIKNLESLIQEYRIAIQILIIHT